MSRRWYKMKRQLRILRESAGANCEQKLQDLRNRHERELERRTEKVESLLEKIAKTHWSQNYRDRSYTVAIDLNPDILGGVSPYRDDLRFLAEMIGRQVEAEIASGHYVRAAHDYPEIRYRRVY
jgi:hypothetical protein